MLGKCRDFKLHLHPEDSKMFTREHQSVVRKGKHHLLPNSQCPVISKIEHVIGLGALTFPASWKKGLYDLLRFREETVFLESLRTVLSIGLWQHPCLTLFDATTMPCRLKDILKGLCKCVSRGVHVCFC